MIDLRVLSSGDEAVLDRVAHDVFDHEIIARSLREFLARPCHHLVVAIEGGVVVGMASGVDYIHPDKPREWWINEVGVGREHRKRGIGRQLVTRLLEQARSRGCRNAWVLSDEDNQPAQKLYRGCGGVRHPPNSVLYEWPLLLEG